MNHSETLIEVQKLVCETLSTPDSEEILPNHLLFYDLDFTSMDMLDLLFRLEDHFQIKIPEGTISNLAQGTLPAHEYEEDGVLTETGRRQLMELLSDTPKEIFPERIHITTLPRYCTVDAMARLVDYKLSVQTPNGTK
jgi:acyl carrier protein